MYYEQWLREKGYSVCEPYAQWDYVHTMTDEGGILPCGHEQLYPLYLRESQPQTQRHILEYLRVMEKQALQEPYSNQIQFTKRAIVLDFLQNQIEKLSKNA